METNDLNNTETNDSNQIETIHFKQIRRIYNLSDILIKYSDENFKIGNLYIDIDNTCMIKESIIAKIFELNPIMRTKIVKNTKCISFGNNDILIKTRYDLNEFVLKCKKQFNKVYFFTKYTKDVLNEITLQVKQIMHDIQYDDIEVITLNQIKSDEIECLFIIDINNESFDKLIKSKKIKNKEKAVLFQMFPV